MIQPEGFKDVSKPNIVCKLKKKALYGLKQAPRAWFEKFRTLMSWGFMNSKNDSSLFWFRNKSEIITILIYVDDILVIIGSCPNSLNEFTQKPNSHFSLKDLGDLHFFLGIEVKRDETGFYLTQEKYIFDLLNKFNLSQVKSCSTPSAIGKQISLQYGEQLADPIQLVEA